jgi:glyoxylase-like metal-dependent hydrolase (beta-lactamase superfamily II)/rhodanese-related sulfurtransferase
VKFVQYYLDCLSQASYLIADERTRVAAVVDPRRDVEEYLADARDAHLEIAFVIETHFHADFLSGHLELADATGAQIVYGAAARADFDFRPMGDGELIVLGDPRDGVVLEVRETPGHTPESISIVVHEHGPDSAPYGVLTGDTLFIGDVGRPDLLASAGTTADELAHQLYASIHDRLLTLPDETRVFPAHGAGSACGKNLSTETMSTIGEQRRTNYALQPMSVDAFVAAVTEGQVQAPDYFAYDASLNKVDHARLDPSPPPSLTVDEVVAAAHDGAVVVDTRDAASFAAGHLVGSINVGLEGRYAQYTGTVIDPGRDLVLVTDTGDEAQAKTRLARIGFDRVGGALAGGAVALLDRPDLVRAASRLTASQLEEVRRALPGLQLVDVRTPAEQEGGTLDGARSIPLAELRHRLTELDLDQPVVVYCAGGYRSSIAASVLRAAGARDVSDVLGGYGACRSSSPAA